MDYPYTVTFPDEATWSRTSDTTITYAGPLGPNAWTFPTTIECSAAWLAVCTH